MDNIFTKGNVVTTDGGQRLAVFDVTEQYAFLAPIEMTEDDIIIKLAETKIYPANPTEDVISALSSLTIKRNKEVVDAEIVEEPVDAETVVNTAVANWQTNGEFVENPAE